MVLPLGLTWANAFLVYFKKNWLQNCPSNFKFHYYGRYVDYTFVLLTSPENLEAFQNFLNGQHANMSFTNENGKQNRISFLDVQIIGEDKTFTTSVYRKKPIGVYTHIDGLLPPTYKFGTVYILTYRCFRICSIWTKLHTELVCLKQILKNDYPKHFINKLF